MFLQALAFTLLRSVLIPLASVTPTADLLWKPCARGKWSLRPERQRRAWGVQNRRTDESSQKAKQIWQKRGWKAKQQSRQKDYPASAVGSEIRQKQLIYAEYVQAAWSHSRGPGWRHDVSTTDRPQSTL